MIDSTDKENKCVNIDDEKKVNCVLLPMLFIFHAYSALISICYYQEAL
jgi:hypothetical protein